jgi:hypothetical protein
MRNEVVRYSICKKSFFKMRLFMMKSVISKVGVYQ